MRTIYWDKPVNVGGRLIFGPLDAQTHMGSSWTAVKDRSFAVAANAILDALAGRASPDVARELFEKALSSSRKI